MFPAWLMKPGTTAGHPHKLFETVQTGGGGVIFNQTTNRRITIDQILANQVPFPNLAGSCHHF